MLRPPARLRLTQLFTWGDITAERYASERNRLGTVREELLVATAPQPTIRVEGMLESWRLGTSEERHQLLGVFFEGLHVSNGQIVAYTPREDRVGEVVELIRAAMGHRETRAAAAGAPALQAFAGSEREGSRSLITNYVAEFG